MHGENNLLWTFSTGTFKYSPTWWPRLSALLHLLKGRNFRWITCSSAVLTVTEIVKQSELKRHNCYAVCTLPNLLPYGWREAYNGEILCMMTSHCKVCGKRALLGTQRPHIRRFTEGWTHSERNNHSSVMVGDPPNTSQFNPHNITSSLSPWSYTAPLSYSLTLNNPTESWPNCNPIMEIEFWLQIGEISHAVIWRDGPDLTCWLGRKPAPSAQVPLLPRPRWAHPKRYLQGRPLWRGTRGT